LQLDEHDGAELWRISLRVAAFRDVDYARFATELQGLVDPVIAMHNGVRVVEPYHPAADRRIPGVHRPRLAAVYTGVVPIVYKAQRALLDSLVQSTFWSFATITPLLMFVARGGRAGIVAMLPNALPVLTVFGGMGWLRLPVDIGSMMSASIALGVAVDDTIHYLTWFREDLKRSNDRREAILGAYRRCATPTLQAALISGIGLSVFAFSTFTPTKQFGLLMLTILLAGAVAELIMLPALLAGPLGAAFSPTWRRRLDRDHTDAPKPSPLLQESRTCLELDTPNCS
jgi:predicted RND superfamily exporter protein